MAAAQKRKERMKRYRMPFWEFCQVSIVNGTEFGAVGRQKAGQSCELTDNVGVKVQIGRAHV